MTMTKMWIYKTFITNAAAVVCSEFHQENETDFRILKENIWHFLVIDKFTKSLAGIKNLII